MTARLTTCERAVEQRFSATAFGACVLDTANGAAFGWREHERFTQASSFKMSLAAMLLAEADGGRVDLCEILHWTRLDMLPVSPVTMAALAKGLSVAELARAALITSDNTAANVLLRRFGGPPRLTAFWRSIGDDQSRLDRYEPELNVTPVGADLDTTTPAAMATTTAALVDGKVLAGDSRATLRAWMTEVETGKDRIRSAFPTDWISGDKTGTAMGSTKHGYVDLVFGGPCGRRPLVVTAYFERTRKTVSMDPKAVAVLEAVGRIAVESLSAA